jgi:hypothetical protein
MKSELNEDVSGSAEVIYATTTIRGVEIPDKGIFKSHNYLHFLIMMRMIKSMFF